MNARQWARNNWDRLTGWSCIALGALSLIIGWLGVSDQIYPAAQLPYILSGGVGGICLVAVGATLLISADLRDEWHKLDELTVQVARLLDASTEPATDAAATETEPTDAIGKETNGHRRSPLRAARLVARDEDPEVVARRGVDS